MAESETGKGQQSRASEADGENRYARLIAHAWADPAFKARLMASPHEALEEFDLGVGPGRELRVVECTSNVDYWVLPVKPADPAPASVPLVQPPAWYQQIVTRAWSDDTFRRRLLAEPRAAAQEFGVKWPAGRDLRVVEDTAELVHFVLPAKPIADGEELSDEMLESVAGGLGTSSTLSSPNTSLNRLSVPSSQIAYTTGVRA